MTSKAPEQLQREFYKAVEEASDSLITASKKIKTIRAAAKRWARTYNQHHAVRVFFQSLHLLLLQVSGLSYTLAEHHKRIEERDKEKIVEHVASIRADLRAIVKASAELTVAAAAFEEELIAYYGR